MSDILRDIRTALRTLRRAPAFALLTMATIALGIGATTAVFSMVHGVLLQRLPYANGDRLVRIMQPSARGTDEGFSVPEIEDYRAQIPGFAAVAEYHSMAFQLYGRGEPQRVQTGVVSDAFFRMLGVQPLLGRLFRPGEDAVGAPPVVVLSYRYWQERLGGDPTVIGTTFTMNDRIHTVIGVLPPLPTYPDANDIWMPAGACPFRSAPAMMHMRDGRMLEGFALLEPGVTLDGVNGQLALLDARLHVAYPGAYPADAKLGIAATSLHDELTRSSRPLLYMLLATAAFVLLVAGANFANLLLARQLRRAPEIALRLALGSGNRQLFRQLLVESLCITLPGALFGILIAAGGLGLLRAQAARVTPRAAEITLDPIVLAAALGVALVVGIGAALVPFLRARPSLGVALRAGSVATTITRADRRGRDMLVAAQVAVAFALLIGAGLMTRSLVTLERADGGYTASGVLSARVDLDWTRYNAGTLVQQFTDHLLERLRGQPGVVAAAVASDFPLNDAQPAAQPFQIDGLPTTAGGPAPRSDFTGVSPGYFTAMGIPLLRGRAFTRADRDTFNVPVVIAHRLAVSYWHGRDPIGTRITTDGGKHWGTVIGVVGDVRQNALATDTTDEVYIPFAIAQTSDVRVLVRTLGQPQHFAPRLRAAVRELDDRQPVVAVQTLDELRGARLAEPRVTTMLLLAFAVLALVITAGGLAGVVSNVVSQRVNEIGIRVALGAQPGRVLWLVVREGMTTVGVGLAVGIAGALPGTRLIARLLYATTPTDPLTYVVVITTLLAIAVLACVLPARRALQVDPAHALRAR